MAKITLRAGGQRKGIRKDPIMFLFLVFLFFGILTLYMYMSTNVTDHESIIAADNAASRMKTFPVLSDSGMSVDLDTTTPSKEMHRRPVPYIPVSPEKDPTGLELLKAQGGSTASADPVTKRTLLGAFGSDFNSTRYEAISCPDQPESGYPKAYDMKLLLDNWNTDDTSIPPFHYNSLCYFDFQTEQHKALNYRKAEVPFVLYNHPEVLSVVERWSDMNYLNHKIGPTRSYKTTTSDTNHFMYFAGKRGRKDNGWLDQKGNPWTPPTKTVDMTFPDWLRLAVDNHNKSLPDRKHFYFRVSTTGPEHWVFNDLPFFQPKPSFFMVDPGGQRGIHCRFGMRSVISENHWDGSRNFAATFGGSRRWILNHPNQCKNLYMFKTGHPSARHSMIDWSEPDYEKFPDFATAQSNEAVMRPGDVLYLPTNWFHYIVSLNINIQCNTRSGRSSQYDTFVEGSRCNLI